MPLPVNCPKCAAEFRVGAAMAGKTVECRSCGNAIRIPAHTPDVPPELSALAANIPDPTQAALARAAAQESLARATGLRVYVGDERPRFSFHNAWFYLISACTFLIVFCVVIVVADRVRKPALAQLADATPDVPAAPSAPRIPFVPGGGIALTPPASPNDDFPNLPDPSHPLPGVSFYQTFFPTGDPSTQTMHVYLLIPDRPRNPLPCVFVAPAGTPCVTGQALSPADYPELLPYVRAGFAVCAYSLDGPLAPNASNAQFAAAVQQFQTADAGCLNARRAIDFVIARAPQVNSHFLFAAGHSSAGTLALLLAAREPRIKAVAAYCPIVDIPAFNHQSLTALDMIRPGTLQFARESSPLTLAPLMANTPIFLFGSTQDQVVDPASFQPFIAALDAASGRLSSLTVSHGDHYHAMIESGIPQGIAFFSQLLPR